MKIILLGAESPKSAVFSKHFKLQSSESFIVGITNKKAVRYIHSRYIDQIEYLPVSINLLEVYLGHFSELVFVIPMTSDWARILSNTNCKNKYVCVLQGSASVFNQLDSKKEYKKWLKEIVRTPETYSLNEINKQNKIVCKPVVGSGSKGVRLLNGKDVVLKLFDNEKYIFEEYIPGKGVCIGGFILEGEVICSMAHLRLFEWPITGGSSAIRCTYSNDFLENSFKEIVMRANWTGFFMVEFKLTPAGQLVAIECNPRAWGGLPHLLVNSNAMSGIVKILENCEGRANMEEFEFAKEETQIVTCSLPLALFVFLKSNLAVKWDILHILKGKVKVDLSLFEDIGGWFAQFIK